MVGHQPQHHRFSVVLSGLLSVSRFLWDDLGIASLMNTFEPDLDYHVLPHPVEKADVFRVAALKWFGGVVRTPELADAQLCANRTFSTRM